MRFIAWLNTMMFGPLCEMGCGHRVYPKDTRWHRAEHCSMARREAS